MLNIAALTGMPIEDIAGRPLAEAGTYLVASITIVRQDVFNTADPAEDNAVYRLANRWHVNTRESVVRELLLFREGDPVTRRVVTESERLLRAKPYLYDARVVANRLCVEDRATANDAVEAHLVVVTRDVWSFSPEIGVRRTGSEHRLQVGVSEINLAGIGAHFDFTLFDNPDRRGGSISYVDGNLGTSRVGIGLRYDDTDDGERVEASIGQPFYALTARRAWNASLLRSNTRQGLYEAGERVESFRRDYRLAQVSAGWSTGLVNGWVNRFSTGITLDHWQLGPDQDASAPTTMEPVARNHSEGSTLVLDDREFVYPWISFSRIEDEFSQARNVDRVQTTEDVYLGRRYDVLFGYSPGDDGHLVGNVEFRDGLRCGDVGILRYGLRLSGYWKVAEGGPENVIGRAWARYRHGQGPRLALFLDAEAMATDALTADQQVLIGGGSGLRGYPNRYQAGTRLFRFTAEERFYTDLYPLRALRVALAGFIDVGRAWSSRQDNDTLANVGVGLRLESTRTNRNLVYHVDVAFPLVDGPGVRGVEVTLTSKRSL